MTAVTPSAWQALCCAKWRAIMTNETTGNCNSREFHCRVMATANIPLSAWQLCIGNGQLCSPAVFYTVVSIVRVASWGPQDPCCRMLSIPVISVPGYVLGRPTELDRVTWISSRKHLYQMHQFYQGQCQMHLLVALLRKAACVTESEPLLHWLSRNIPFI